MTKKLIPSPHILFAFRNKGLPAADAISELIDNGLVTGNKFWFQFLPDRVIAIDNGAGLADMDAIFGLGYSQSKYVASAIGEFGIGSKDAQMHFGARCKVQSVHQGRYYEHAIDWDKVERSGEWPDTFSGVSRPVASAPEPIRHGGTMITINKLTDRPRVMMDQLVKRLTHRYRPGLLQGNQITIRDARKGKDKVYELKASQTIIKSATTRQSEAAGRKFTLTYGMLDQYDPLLTGVHFGFGKRFVISTNYLAETTVPSRLYAEVMLSDEWKDCLGPNKTKIVHHWRELELAVFELLADWIKKLDKDAEHVRIEHVNLALTADFSNVVTLNRKKTGDQVADQETKVSEPHNGPGPLEPDPHKVEHTTKPASKDEAGNACQDRKSRRGGISFRQNNELGNIAAKYKFSKGSLMVELNAMFPIIELAYQPPYKPVGLWPIIAREFANFCKDHVGEIDHVLPGFIDSLNNQGYDVDLERTDEMADKVFAYILRQCPLSTAERKKVGKLRVAVNNDDDTDHAEGAAS